MPRLPSSSKTPPKDIYWFAHGGIESNNMDKSSNQRSATAEDYEEDKYDSISPISKSLIDQRGLSEEQNSSINSIDSNSLRSCSIEGDKHYNAEKHFAAEGRRKQLWELEQERNEAVLRKHTEREAAFEAQENAQRSTISFAFGSTIPRNIEILTSTDIEKNRNSPASGFLEKGSHDNIMSRSMTAAVPASRGRRKNDLMPTVPCDRTAASKLLSSGTTRKRSVSMTRLDQLAQPRKHIEVNKANSTINNITLSLHKAKLKSPTRPLSSASERPAGSGQLQSSKTQCIRSSPRKPRPVSIAGTIPDDKISSQLKKNKKTENKKGASSIYEQVTSQSVEKPKQLTVKAKHFLEKSKLFIDKTGHPVEKSKQSDNKVKPTVGKSRLATADFKTSATPISIPKNNMMKNTTAFKIESLKTPTAMKNITNKKKSAIMISSQSPAKILDISPSEIKEVSPPSTSYFDDLTTEAEHNSAKHISEEEAKAALAEKRRLAREQAEKEAELERQKKEELRKQEQEHLQLEKEEQKKLEEELEEHYRLEEEKLKKAIEENERKEIKEQQRKEEEQRLKVEQEKKAQEEAEKQHIELEEKLRKEEEERAQRKKRLEKIMSRTRGKSNSTSPSGSISEQYSAEIQQVIPSCGKNSLDSSSSVEIPSECVSLVCSQNSLGPSSDTASIETNPTYELNSDNDFFNDMTMPKNDPASQDNSLIIPVGYDLHLSSTDDHVISTDQNNIYKDVKFQDKFAVNNWVKDLNGETVNVEKSVVTAQKIPEVNEQVLPIVTQNVKSKEIPSHLLEPEPIFVENHEAFTFQQTQSIFDCTTNALQFGTLPSKNDMEKQNLYLNASDFKLPDPIYETSEDGSISSEKQPDFALTEDPYEMQNGTDEVFNGIKYENSGIYANSNPFETLETRCSADINQLKLDIMQNICITNDDLGTEQFQEGEKCKLKPTNCVLESTKNQEIVGLNNIFSQNINPFADDISSENEHESEIKNSHFNIFDKITPESETFEVNHLQIQDNSINNYKYIQQQQDILKHVIVKNADFKLSDLTIIKSQDSDNCIGKISSLDNDHISDNLAQQSIQNELLQFQCSSMTDSEHSSVDSNLSQVMSIEKKETDTVEPSQTENAFSKSTENPFDTVDCKEISNVDLYPESESLCNQHRLESANPNLEQIGDYLQLDSKHISSVDQPKTNIFDNVDVVNYGQMSSDPFPVKGTTSQISGNPYFLQDDSKKILMVPDFFN